MKKLNILFLFVLSISIVFGEEKSLENPEKLLLEIKKISASTTSIESDFVQEKKVSYLKEPIKSTGKFYTANGNMRWQQDSPYLYIMLLSEAGMRIKNDDKEQNTNAMADKFMEQIRNVLMSSVDGSFAESEDFTPTYFENENYYLVKLKPENRRLSKIFGSINLSFHKTSYRLKILSFVQEDGVSDMYFSNEKFNQDLSPELFTKF